MCGARFYPFSIAARNSWRIIVPLQLQSSVESALLDECPVQDFETFLRALLPAYKTVNRTRLDYWIKMHSSLRDQVTSCISVALHHAVADRLNGWDGWCRVVWSLDILFVLLSHSFISYHRIVIMVQTTDDDDVGVPIHLATKYS